MYVIHTKWFFTMRDEFAESRVTLLLTTIWFVNIYVYEDIKSNTKNIRDSYRNQDMCLCRSDLYDCYLSLLNDLKR
jgi:hypothetical protein